MNTSVVIVILIVVLCEGYVGTVSGENSDIVHYSRTLIESIIDICAGNSSIIRHTNTAEAPNSRTTTKQTRPTLVPVYIYPYILLALWIVCICNYNYKRIYMYMLRIHSKLFCILFPFRSCNYLLLFVLQVSAGGNYDGPQYKQLRTAGGAYCGSSIASCQGLRLSLLSAAASGPGSFTEIK